MANSRTVLVTAASGNIGADLVPILLDADFKLVLPTSSASRLQSKLPSNASSSNVAVEEGDIAEPAWVESILKKHNVDTVFLNSTGANELYTALNFLDAMRRAGTKHLVYQSANGDFVSEDGMKQTMGGCGAANVLVKATVEGRLKYAPRTYTSTVLGPTVFFGNDFRSQGGLLKDGMYLDPLGEVGVSRVSTRDIATVAKNVMLAPEKYDGEKIMIGSKKTFTGTEICEIWSKALGKEIKMVPATEEGYVAFEKEFEGMTGVKWGLSWCLRLMYETMGNYGFSMSEKEYERQVEVLGREADDYVEFVEKVAASWK